MARENPDFIGAFFVSSIRFREPKMFFDKKKRLPTLLCAGSRSWIFRYLSYSMSPLSLSRISISVPLTFFRTILSISFSLKDRGASLIGFLSMA